MASRFTRGVAGSAATGTAGNGPPVTPRAVRTPTMSTTTAAAAVAAASASNLSRPAPQPTALGGRARTSEPRRPSQLQPSRSSSSSSSDSDSSNSSDSEREDGADAKKLETAAQDDYQHMFAMSRFQIAKLKRQLAAASAAAAAGKAPTTAQTAQLETQCQKLQTQVAALQAQLAAQPPPQDDGAVAATVLQHQAQLEAMIAERKQLLVQLLKLNKKADASTQCDDLMPLNAAPHKCATKDTDTQTDALPESPTVKTSADQTADIDQLTRAVQVYKKSSAMHQRLADDLSIEVQELRKQLQARMAAPLPSPSMRAVDAAHSQLEQQLQELQITVTSKDTEIADLKSQLSAANKERQSLNRQVTLKTSKLNRLSEALDKAQADVRAANLRLEKEQASVARLRQQLASAPSPRIRPAASARSLLADDASPKSELGRARQFPSGLRALASMPSLPIGMSSSSPDSAVSTSTSFTSVDDLFSPVHAVPSTPSLQTVQENVTFMEAEPQSQPTPVLSIVPALASAPLSTALVFDEPQATADAPMEQAAHDKPAADVATPSDSGELQARRPPLPAPSQSGVMASPVVAPAREASPPDVPLLMPRRLSTSSAAPMSSNASVVSGVGTRVRAPLTVPEQPAPHVNPWPTVRLQPLTAHRDSSVGDIV